MKTTDMTAPPLSADMHDRLAELDADRAHARRFFWTWLVCATGVTLAGNAGHMMITKDMPPLVRLSVALIPPLIALLAVHGVTVLARVGHGERAGKSARTTFRVAVVVTVVLAIDAAVMSFAGLYGLARDSGLPQSLAVLFPLAIDAGIVVATLAIYHLRPSSAADLRAAHEAAERERVDRERAEAAAREAAELERERLEAEREERAWEREQRALAAAERARALANGQVTEGGHVNGHDVNGYAVGHNNGHTVNPMIGAVNGHARPMPDPVNGHDRHLTEARSLIERTGKRSDPVTVAEVLRHLDADTPVAQISAELGMGERTIRQIRDSRQPEFANAS